MTSSYYSDRAFGPPPRVVEDLPEQAAAQRGELVGVDTVGEEVPSAELLAERLRVPGSEVSIQSGRSALTPQIGPVFTGYVYDARLPNEWWGSALLRLRADGFPGLARAAAGRAVTTIRTVLSRLGELETTMVADADGWADWLTGELPRRPVE